MCSRLLANYYIHLRDQFKVNLSSLSRICRTIRRKFSISHFNCARDPFHIFETCTTFPRLFRDIVYPRSWIAPNARRKKTGFSSFSFTEQCHFDLSHRGCVFQNLLPISVRKIPYKDGRSTRKFRAVISRWLDTIIKALNVHFRREWL